MAHVDYFSDIATLSRAIRARRLSAVELTTALLARIRSLDGKLRSFVTVTNELALAQARAADEEIAVGRWRGPLHGVPIAVKDLLWTKGIPTTAGMPIHADFRPPADATVISRLAAAGAVLLGKLGLTEGAVGDHHPDIPPPVNPWDETAWPGASSSGSGVAVASGLCVAALGTDTGGSIRFPSAANGVTGLKPSWGRVSRHGLFPLSDLMDCVGPMARSAADAALMLAVLAGADANDPTASREPVPDYAALASTGITNLRLGLDPAVLKTVDAPTAAAIDYALTDFGAQGARIVHKKLPDLEGAVRAWRIVCSAGAARAHRDTFAEHREAFGPSLRAVIEHGHTLTPMEIDQALSDREWFRGKMFDYFDDVDVLLLPVQAMAAPTIAEMRAASYASDWRERLLRYVAPFALTGQPVLVLPCGATIAGRPIGLQLISQPMQETLILRAGHAYQSVTDWHHRRPEGLKA
jgi:amidase